MPKKIVESEIESSGYDLMVCVSKVIKAQKESGSGLQEALSSLISVLEDVKDLPADLKEDKLGLLKGINLGAYAVLDEVLA